MSDNRLAVLAHLVNPDADWGSMGAMSDRMMKADDAIEVRFVPKRKGPPVTSASLLMMIAVGGQAALIPSLKLNLDAHGFGGGGGSRESLASNSSKTAFTDSIIPKAGATGEFWAILPIKLRESLILD